MNSSVPRKTSLTLPGDDRAIRMLKHWHTPQTALICPTSICVHILCNVKADLITSVSKSVAGMDWSLLRTLICKAGRLLRSVESFKRQ